MTEEVPKTAVSSRFSLGFKPLKPLGRLYWSRFFIAIMTGIVCAVLRQTDLPGVMLGIVFYLFSSVVAIYVLRITPEQVGGRTTLYTKGIATYIFVWITVWTISGSLMP